MSDWAQEVAAAEAEAQRLQDAETVAESQFHEVRAQARAAGRDDDAVQSPEFQRWMSARHATDAAWGAWSQVMDSKPAG